MGFLVNYRRLFHNPGCPAFALSWKDILPTAAFRSQPTRDESPQVEFVAPNKPTVKQSIFDANVTTAPLTQPQRGGCGPRNAFLQPPAGFNPATAQGGPGLCGPGYAAACQQHTQRLNPKPRRGPCGLCTACRGPPQGLTPGLRPVFKPPSHSNPRALTPATAWGENPGHSMGASAPRGPGGDEVGRVTAAVPRYALVRR